MSPAVSSKCYLCGLPANDVLDHVPPRCLYRGSSGRDYENPEVIKIPACRIHNADMGVSDEALAWFLTSYAAINHAGNDVYESLMDSARKMRTTNHPEYVKRLKRHGISELTSPNDYDLNGRPRPIAYTKEYFEAVHQKLIRDWATVKRAIQKVSAGLHFYATNCGVRLGESNLARLRICAPEMKQIESENWPFAHPPEEHEFFAKLVDHHAKKQTWSPIASGSPDVFRCEHLWRESHPTRFAIKMTFFGATRVWVSSDL